MVADRQYYTLVERRTTGPDGRLTIENRLYQADNKATLGRRVPLQSLAQYERLADAYTYPAPLDGLGLVALDVYKRQTISFIRLHSQFRLFA